MIKGGHSSVILGPQDQTEIQTVIVVHRFIHSFHAIDSNGRADWNHSALARSCCGDCGTLQSSKDTGEVILKFYQLCYLRSDAVHLLSNAEILGPPILIIMRFMSNDQYLHAATAILVKSIVLLY